MSRLLLLSGRLTSCSSSLCSNLEYKDTPIDIAQLPNLPEKTSESSETSDSESESKENSGTIENPPLEPPRTA